MTDNDKIGYIFESMKDLKKDLKSTKHHLLFNSIVTSGLFAGGIFFLLITFAIFSNVEAFIKEDGESTIINLHNSSNASNKSTSNVSVKKTDKKGLFNK